MALDRSSALLTALALMMIAPACTTSEGSAVRRPADATGAPLGSATPDGSAAPHASPEVESQPESKWVTRTPAWLGTRVLPKGPTGFGERQPTPPVLRNRRLATIDLFPRPQSRRFAATVGPVPPDVAERSSWRPRCPVGLDDLSYVKMTFWGFDHEPHMGEMVVNAAAADEVVDVFAKLYKARFPIEEMRVIGLREVREGRRKPTGDGNVTSSFECRQVTLGESWSQHSYGLAIDVNPFHNPYLRDDLLAPELAGAYTDRNWLRPGMIVEGDVVTRAFDAIGWGWGGRWSALKDWMHFSLSGT